MALNQWFFLSKPYGRGEWCLIFFAFRRVRLPHTPARGERCVTPSDIRRNIVFEFDKREGAQSGKISA